MTRIGYEILDGFGRRIRRKGTRTCARGRGRVHYASRDNALRRLRWPTSRANEPEEKPNAEGGMNHEQQSCQ